MDNPEINRELPHKGHKKMPCPTPMMLINDISRMMRWKLHSKDDERSEIFKSSRVMLMHLAMEDGRTQLDLVHATRLKAPTVSVTLQRMERDGLVTRTSDPNDMRRTIVRLTDKGRKLEQENLGRAISAENELISILSEEEKAELTTILKKLRDKLWEDNLANE